MHTQKKQKKPHRNSHLANSLHFPDEHQDVVVSLLCLFLISLMASHVWPPTPTPQPLLSKGITQTVSPELRVISTGGKLNVSPCLRVARRVGRCALAT